MGRKASGATVHGVTNSQTWLNDEHNVTLNNWYPIVYFVAKITRSMYLPNLLIFNIVCPK